MKKTYLALAIIGFAVPNILVFQESIETGNIMLYADIPATLSGMFANRISTIFGLDLLIAVLVFFVWSFNDYKAQKNWKFYSIWLVTLLFGLAGAFPLYLALKENPSKTN
jgi:hypothetical protein